MNKVLSIIFFLFYCQITFAQPVMSDSIEVVKLLERGDKAFLKNDTGKAIQLYSRAKTLAKKNSWVNYDAKATFLIGNIYYKYELYHRAFNNYGRARAILVNAFEENELLLDIITALAKTQYHRGSYRLSSTHFIESIRIARTLNKKAIEAESLDYLGLLYNAYQGHNEGTRYYLASFRVKKLIPDEKGAVRVAHILGET
jgi:tetratricopeptide (TPR) repeat protein